MTTITQTFIDLRDIVSLRFECNKCKSQMRIRLDQIETTQPHIPMICGACSTSYFFSNLDTHWRALLSFIGSLAELRKTQRDWTFNLMLEIPSVVLASARVSDDKD